MGRVGGWRFWDLNFFQLLSEVKISGGLLLCWLGGRL
jgi:hypothetical protein